MQRRSLSPDIVSIFLIAGFIGFHIAWMYYTRYIEEDAFITFRFAEQIARGNGFVYNTGEHVYGTTTPLFTILLSLWLAFISSDVVLGANILNLLAAAAIPVLTWKTLKFLGRSNAEQFFVLTALLLSSKLIYMNTHGMEISLSLALMAGSWYAWVKGKVRLTGLLCGLLLWTRIDGVFWLIVLILGTAITNRKDAFHLAIIAVSAYLPWIIFAVLYFGSPIPHTITAKWVAYSQFNESPYTEHLGKILNYLSVYRNEDKLLGFGTALVLGVAGWGIWKNRLFKEKTFYILVLFALIEISRLTFTRATFFNRYFIPIVWSALILFGMGLGAVWNRLRTNPVSRTIFLSLFVLLTATQILSGISFAGTTRERQVFRHEASLKAMGSWLKTNTPAQSTILLEPLGYIGYYSNRIMIDEVGLVTPSVTDLKRRQIGPEKYALLFKPDYIIVHCDDKTRIPAESDLSYRLVKTFDPLNFEQDTPNSEYIAWASCYQIWEKDR